MGFLKSIFGTYSEKQIAKLTPTVNKIEAMADKYSAMSDEELKAETPRLKALLAEGKTLDDILPEAFAAVREACWRVLDKRPFRVQLMGGIVLHQGRIAEMKTGEGKTIVATMPAYLNALNGQGVHIVTVNEYLARLGAEEMGRVYNFMGLTCGVVCHGQSRDEKQAAYNSDITYGTNNEMGFDYLRDNMVLYKEHKSQRGHIFGIVDEVDSILIDEARTPLIISGEGEESTDMYDRAEELVRRMREFRIKEIDDKQDTDDVDADYIVDEKARTTVLTASGIAKAEAFFGLENFSDPENSEIAHHVNQAVRAHGIMHRDVDYVVRDGEVLIVDTFTGRIMPGRRWSDGLHQAVEAKEHVKIEKENKTLATITFQNYFRLYKKLSGMTGTALTEEDEFREIYNLDVVEIPTNKPMIRIDHADVVYKTVAEKYAAIIEQVKECHAKGQPVLVGTVSVDKSEELSRLLKREGIPHNVLNAKQHEKEAEIVACAGQVGSVTISTNMAGRGTDIMLGGNPEFFARREMKKMDYDEETIGLAVGSSTSVSDEVLAAREVYRELFKKYRDEIAPLAKQVCDAGGLFIVGSERHESRRIDNQLRGRSGRQGDPGESRFFLSVQDDLMRLFGSERMQIVTNRLPDGEPISAGILSGAIERAQKQLEANNFDRRKRVLEYDDVMNQQRTVIYNQRDEVLDGVDMHEKIEAMIHEMINTRVDACAPNPDAEGEDYKWDLEPVRTAFEGLLFAPGELKYTDDEMANFDPEPLREMLTERAMKLYRSKDEIFGEQMREIERVILLRRVDINWMDQLDAMDDLKESIGLQAYAQRKPIQMYRMEGADMFDAMIDTIKIETVRGVLSVMPRQEIKREAVAKVTGEAGAGAGGDDSVKKKPLIKKPGEKVGRNDLCPCGSGKKYKKCCGANKPDGE